MVYKKISQTEYASDEVRLKMERYNEVTINAVRTEIVILRADTLEENASTVQLRITTAGMKNARVIELVVELLNRFRSSSN